MGLTITITCVAEVPVFFFTGWLLEAVGVHAVLHGVLAVYILRLAYYSVLQYLVRSCAPEHASAAALLGRLLRCLCLLRKRCEPAAGAAGVTTLAAPLTCAGDQVTPWAVLPIELLHGVTFGLAWAAGTINCSRISPPGLETVTQAIFQVWLASRPSVPAACMGCACTRPCQRRARTRCDVPACLWARGVVAALISAVCAAGIVFRRRPGPGRPGWRPHLPPLRRPRRLCQRRAGPGGRVVPLRAGAGAREVLAQLQPRQGVGSPCGAFRSGSVCLRALLALD